jgi:exonuclease SbcC
VIVREVRLENIKSYGSPAEVIHLTGGVNAICGQNGSGKSTVLEAIGAALFQQLPYQRHENFVREGESTGTITVVVDSRLDGRTYEIVRKVGRGATHYVFDVDLGQQLARGESDVGRWLRQHLGVESDIDLKSLFLDTVGPPQGTLTAVFLDAPQVRRAKFNRLLRVEEYEDAYRRLSGLESAVDEERNDQRMKIRELEVKTSGRPDLEFRRAARRAEQAALGVKLSRIVAEEETLDRILEEFEAANRRWSAARAALDLARERERHALAEAGRARGDVEAARDAAKTCQETRADRDAFLAAEQDLAVEDKRRAARDRLRDRLHDLQLQLMTLRTELDRVDREISRGEDAAREIAALELKVPAQEAAEARVAAAREADRELVSLRQRKDDIKERGTRAAERLARAEKLVADALALEPIAAELAARRQRHAETADELATVSRAEGELAALVKAAQEVARRIATYQQHIRDIDDKRQAIEIALETVVDLETLESRHREVTARRAMAESRLGHAVETRGQVNGGQCPFLLEPCQNLRPGVTLETYFDQEARRWQRLVDQLDGDVVAIDRDLLAARALDRERLSSEQLRRERDNLTRELTAAEGQLEGLCQSRDAASALVARRGEVRRAEQAAAAVAREAESAAQEAARLPSLREDAQVAKEDLDTCRKEWQEAKMRLSGAGDVEAEMKAALAAAEEIGRPRELIERFHVDANRLPEARTRRQAVGANADRVDAVIRPIAVDVGKYEDVDRRTAELRAARESLRSRYEQYVAALPLAMSLDARVQSFELAEGELHARTGTAEAAQAECDLAARDYDPAAHQASQKHRAELSADVGQARTQIEVASQDEARLSEELETMDRLEEELAAARQAAERLDEERVVVGLIRQAVRATGPEMTRRLLGSISRLATSINAEILSQGGIEVEWTADYDVVTRRQGENRGFAQLSGGEQMAAALAVRMAAMRLLSNVRVAFLDEPTAHLDQSRRANLGDQVQRLQGFDQLVVISHDDTFDGLFGHVIRVDKRDGRSRVIAED